MTTRVIPLRAHRRKPRGHTVVTLDVLERLCPDGVEVTYPEVAGWATYRVGSQRFAAWFAPPTLLIPEPAEVCS